MESTLLRIVSEEIEKALTESPSSPTWDGVTELSITDIRSSFWRRYKERLSGARTEQWITKKLPNHIKLEAGEMDSDMRIWKQINDEYLHTLNILFPDIRAVDLNDKIFASLELRDIEKLYRQGVDDDVVLNDCVRIDAICDPILRKFSEKVGEIGKCCSTEWLRSKSQVTALSDLCGKRNDLSGTTDWVMKRYGGSRRESSLFLSIMFWIAYYTFLSCGRFETNIMMDCAIGLINSVISDYVSSIDGDRTTHTIDKTGLAKAAESSAENSIPTSTKIRLGIETVMAARRVYAKKYNDVYKEVCSAVDPKDITPTAYIKSRYVDGVFTTAMDLLLISEFGEAYDTMNGSIFVGSIASGCYYNDLSDCIMDLKFMESHNYVVCAKANSNYSFSDHCEALYVALLTFDEPYLSYDSEIRNRLCSYRLVNLVFVAIWPRYRAPERARRYVAALSQEDLNKLLQRGRKCIQGEVYIAENMWLDAMCANFNNRRKIIQNRGYAENLIYLLGLECDESAKSHIQSVVEANGKHPFDTALELVSSLGSKWLAKVALKTVKFSGQYESLVAELSDWLTTLSLSSMPIISDNTITPCESICGSLCFRLIEILTVLSEIDSITGEAVMRTVASAIGMVSLDPFRCLAYQADALLLT